LSHYRFLEASDCKIAIAIAIVIFGFVVAGALTAGFSNMHSAIVNMGDSIRDGLIKVANQ